MNSPANIPNPTGGGQLPFWSVMIPVYRPDAGYLNETLESVLHQDPGPEQMQIEVVDDCSPGMDVVALVKSIAGDRVRVSQTPKNLGLAGGWNACIERAHGEWVHILHQDDLVLPGFYDHLKSLTETHPETGMAFCRFAVMDGHGHWQGLGPLEQIDSGLLDNWLERVISGYHVECPAVVVKRSVYEHLGRFSHELNFALDLEMWIRIAAHYPVAYEPTILACYRRHANNETARLAQGGTNMMDVARALDLCRTYLPADRADHIVMPGRLFWAGVTLRLAEEAYASDNLNACVSQLQTVRALCNRGQMRKRRLVLAARTAIKRALGPRLLATIRRLRSSN